MKPSLRLLQLLLLFAAVVLIAYGLNVGGFRDVLGKAVFVCYECMGIG